MAIAGPIASSDDAKDTAVEDGIAEPAIPQLLRQPSGGYSAGAYAR